MSHPLSLLKVLSLSAGYIRLQSGFTRNIAELISFLIVNYEVNYFKW